MAEIGLSDNYYYCTKCGHNHRYTSKIGREHIEFILKEPIIEEPQLIVPEEKPETITPTTEKVVKKKNRLARFIEGYRDSYRKGVEKFGIWWSIFQISIWSIALIFIVMAGIILIIYLPKIEMIYWDLQ